MTSDAPDAPDADRVRASLRRLAGADERTVIERADAGLDQEVGTDTTVQLDGTGSAHPDGVIDGYE